MRQETVQWKQVSIFLGLTFSLTYLLNLVLHLTTGYGENTATGVLLQMQMLIPATVAMVLQLLVFKDSPLYHLKELPRWFFYFYLAFVALFVLVAVGVLLVPDQLFQAIANLMIQLVLIAGLLLAVGLRLASGQEAFKRAGLSGGKVWHYLLFGLALIVLYGIMTALNALLGLGHAANIREMLTQAAGGQAQGLDMIPDWALSLLIGFQAVILGPLLGWLIALGEEYGWRGYLQGELIKIGKVPGILLVGVIWGLWHTPIILMGHNYPGQPVLGSFLMLLYCIVLGFFLGYAVLKSGSVWLAAFLHALNNQVLSFLMVAVYMPDDRVWSFGVGIYGILLWASVVVGLLLLDRKAWARNSGWAG